VHLKFHLQGKKKQHSLESKIIKTNIVNNKRRKKWSYKIAFKDSCLVGMQVVVLLWNLENEHGQHVHQFCNNLFIFYQIFNGFLVLKPQNSHHLSNIFMAYISWCLLVLCLPLLTFWSSFSWMYGNQHFGHASSTLEETIPWRQSVLLLTSMTLLSSLVGTSSKSIEITRYELPQWKNILQHKQKKKTNMLSSKNKKSLTM
jgi:hypothetical protein